MGLPPGRFERLVKLRDDLPVSLIQARAIERNLPIRLVIDS
jgi:hypothetical protein